jgi:hypothetical protein
MAIYMGHGTSIMDAILMSTAHVWTHLGLIDISTLSLPNIVFIS